MPDVIRADRWLWFARFFQSRTVAAQACSARRIRRNGAVLTKANQTLRVGDILTFAANRTLHVVRVVALGARRGPVEAARQLYEDLAPPQRISGPGSPGVRQAGTRRPTKADRRALDRLREPM